MDCNVKNMNLLGIIAFVGSILIIVGAFLTWINAPGMTYSGWEMFTTDDEYIKGFTAGGLVFSGVHYTFLPLLGLICGIISLLLMIVPTFMNVEKFENINNILGIVTLVLSLVIVILGILFITQSVSMDYSSIITTKKLFEGDVKVGIGVWFTIIGAAITLIGGAMPIVKNKLLK